MGVIIERTRTLVSGAVHYEFIVEETASFDKLPTQYSEYSPKVAPGSRAYDMEAKKGYWLPSTGVWTEVDAKAAADGLDSIEISRAPFKVEYNSGDELDLTGLLVNAIYKSGKKKIQVELTSTSPADGATLDDSDTTLTVTYTEDGTSKTATVGLTINPVPASVAVTTPPTKTEYTVGESFDPTGMVVTGTYSDSDTEVLEDGEYTYAPTGALTAEDEAIIITWQGKTATQVITVTAEE